MEINTTPAEGTPEVSVEDRAASLFSDRPTPEQAETRQEAAPEQEAPAETVPEVFELEYEGEKFQLPKKLEKAVMQERDYTQKSQSLAEMRKDVERQFTQIKLAQQEAQIQQAVKAETDQIAMIDAVLDQFKSLKWQEMSTDDLVRKKLEMDQYRDMRTALEQQVTAKKAQLTQGLQAEVEKLKAEAKDTLKKRLNWSDETETEVRTYVRELGITDAEYDGVFDPRHKQILWEASQYRKLKANAQPVAQQVKAAKTQSSNPMPQQVKEKLAFRKALDKTGNDPIARRAVIEQQVANLFNRR